MDLWILNIPLPLALAVVATLGYLFGRRGRISPDTASTRSRRELRRAELVAVELEKIAGTVRRSLARHHASVRRFRQRVGQLSDEQQEATAKQLCREAEEILQPTLELATQIATAYEGIRQQSTRLMTFTEVRTDPLTGVNNRRALDETLAAQFALSSRYRTEFSLVIFDIDHFKQVNDQQGHLYGDQMLKDLARLIDDIARETDVIARFGGEEFVVIMPHTDLPGAGIFAERIRRAVEKEMPLSISGGVTTAIETDCPESLLGRADEALYAAKAAGRNCVFSHTGEHAEAVRQDTELVTI